MELTLAQKRALAEAEALKAKTEAEGGIGGFINGFFQRSNPIALTQQVMGVEEAKAPDPAETGYVPSAVPMLDPVNAALNKAVNAIPVAGPLLNSVGNNVDAAFNNALGFEHQTPEDRARINQSEAEQFPVPALMGEVAGTVGPLMLAGSTALGGKLLGMAGSLPQRMAAGFLSGGTLAGADTAARGGRLEDTIWNALKGAGVGTVFPMAEKALTPIVNALMAQAPRAAQVVARGLGRDKVDDIMAALQDKGPDAVLMDLGPNLTRQGAAIASLPGEGQTILREALTARNAGANARIQGTVDDIFGPAPVPSRLQADIRAGQQALQPEYEEVFRHAMPVNTRPLAESLQDMANTVQIGSLRQTVDRLRGYLMNTDDMGRVTLSSDPRRLMAIRREIDILMDNATDNTTRGFLTSARQQVDDMLALAVPGIKEVDARFEQLAEQATGLTTGSGIMDSGKTAVRPQEVADMMAAQPSSELFIGPNGAPFRISQGARAEIERIIGTTANNLTALKQAVKGDGSWNRQRLASVFGDDKADALINLLEREWAYADNANTVLRNSETAARIAAQGDVTPMVAKPIGLSEITTGPLVAMANAAARSRSEAVNAKIADLLMSRPSAETVDQLIAARNLAIQKALLAPAAPALMATGQ